MLKENSTLKHIKCLGWNTSDMLLCDSIPSLVVSAVFVLFRSAACLHGYNDGLIGEVIIVLFLFSYLLKKKKCKKKNSKFLFLLPIFQ